MKLFLKRIFIYVSFLSFNFTVFSVSRGGQDLVLPGSWVYDAMLTLEMEMARTTFSDQAPVSIIELKSYLDDIDYDRLSAVGKIQYERVMNYINEKNWSLNAGLFSLGIEPSMTPEFYYKSDADIPWIYDYTKRQAMFDIPIKVGVGDFATVYMGLTGTQNYTARFSSDNYINHIFGLKYFDPILTHENYLSLGYCWPENIGINLRIGTGTQSIGNTLMPSIIMSEYLTDAPYINLRVFSPICNYNFNVTQLTRETYFYSHRIEARLFKKLELSFMEGVLPYSSFDLRFANPFAIFHGFGLFNEYQERCSSFFGIKASFTPVKYLRIYGLYAQNEHTMQSEKEENNDYSTPEGMGFQAGIESYIPLKKGYLHIGTEFYYATPYMFIKENPNVSFAKVFNEMVFQTPDYYQWMGSPLGPDTFAFQVALGYEQPDKWAVDLTYSFAAMGEFAGTRIFQNSLWQKSDLSYNAGSWVYPSTNPQYADGVTFSSPHGIVQYYNAVRVKGVWKPLDFLTVSLQPGFSFIYNYDHQIGNFKSGFEITLSTRIELTKISKKELSSDFFLRDGKEK